MEFVVTQLILHPQQNEHGAGHANGQPGNIDCGKGFVPSDVSEGDREIRFKHPHMIFFELGKYYAGCQSVKIHANFIIS